MYIVTGGAGFIGANIVAGLNQQGITEILVVDNLTRGDKFLNIRDLSITDFMDKTEFRAHLHKGTFKHLVPQAIFHQGACSDTMEYDGRYMMDNNFTYSKELLHFALDRSTPFLYASSAAVYGASTQFVEDPNHEKPLNVYGYSKLLFDRYVEQLRPRLRSTVVGLRYFNVYGPREQHKGRMASMVYQLHQQLQNSGVAHLFEGSGGYGHGEQRRDFICVADVVRVNLFLARQQNLRGVCNVGSGQSRSFNDIAHHLIRRLGRGELRYKPMPEELAKKYQNFTEANVTRLRRAGFSQPFTTLEAGIDTFLEAEGGGATS
ncbi:MAG: ADP-glyceromanno-heptose 6-epimerase [Magnetococcales bacterium]|nr:ADP-glyceromanno-heptose 6-epimerase [Magnetococcales bacterium]